MISAKAIEKKTLVFLCLTLLFAVLATFAGSAADSADVPDAASADASADISADASDAAETETSSQSSGFTGTIKTFFLETVGKRWCVFFCSMIPIIELRGAVPMGAAFGLPWWQTFLISVAGNMLPVPFILLFIGAILRWMAGCRVKFLNRFAGWLFRKAEKNREKVEKYAFWGLALFVGVPLPGTGAWSGALLAVLLNLRLALAVPAILAGIVIAGTIMFLGTSGVLGIFSLAL